jgi:hypothetical protein
MAKGQTRKLDYLTHHEAGHAAVAFSFGLPLGPVRIDTDDDSGTFEMPIGATDMQQVLIALAGGRAEKYLDPSCVDEREGSKRDEACALTIIHARFYGRLIAREQPYFDKLCKRVNKRLVRRCAFIVEERWPAIQRLAAVLAKCAPDSRAADTRLVELCGEKAEDVLADGW